MALKNYLVDEAIQVTYQADKAGSGKTVTMEIFDETGAKDPVDFPDVTMTEIGSTGRYTGSFTPDAQGEWVVMIADSDGKGKVVQQFSVGGYNLDGIGQTVDNIDVNTTDLSNQAMIG